MIDMEFKISNEVYNPLLKRKEISVEIEHKGEGTPQRFDVRKRMASKFGAKIDNVFVVGLRTSTGVEKTICSLQIYDDPATAALTVPEHLAIRNLSPEERAKKKEAKPAEAEKAAPAPTKPAAKAGKEPETKTAVKAEAKPPK